MSWGLPYSRSGLIAAAAILAATAAAPGISQSTKGNLNEVKGESTQKDHKDWSHASSMHCDNGAVRPTSGVASDPEEGGQVSARKTHMSDMHVTKHMDKASPLMMDTSPSGGGC